MTSPTWIEVMLYVLYHLASAVCFGLVILVLFPLPPKRRFPK